MTTTDTIAVTGATGQLGRRVIEHLLHLDVQPSRVIALARNPDAAADLVAKGVRVRQADYNVPASLDAALRGVQRLLLISSNEVGRRLNQHRQVITAAQRAGSIGLLAYTSLLRADTSPLQLAAEHLATEQLLAESGLPVVVLRNGWYSENHLASLPPALAHGVLLGSAQQGRIASATRQDYAEAAARVMVSRDKQAGRVYELAGDKAHTLAELASEISRQSGKSVTYQDLPEAAYRQALLDAGLPEPLASIYANSDAKAAQGALFDEGRELSRLIGRPTTSLASATGEALRALNATR